MTNNQGLFLPLNSPARIPNPMTPLQATKRCASGGLGPRARVTLWVGQDRLANPPTAR